MWFVILHSKGRIFTTSAPISVNFFSVDTEFYYEYHSSIRYSGKPLFQVIFIKYLKLAPVNGLDNYDHISVIHLYLEPNRTQYVMLISVNRLKSQQYRLKMPWYCFCDMGVSATPMQTYSWPQTHTIAYCPLLHYW